MRTRSTWCSAASDDMSASCAGVVPTASTVGYRARVPALSSTAFHAGPPTFKRAIARMTRTLGILYNASRLDTRYPPVLAVAAHRAHRDLELEQLQTEPRRGRVQRLQPWAAQLLRRDQHASHAVLGSNRCQMIQAAQHRQAVNPFPQFEWVVVDEAERLETQRGVVQQLAHRQLAPIARPIDRDALARLQSGAHGLERAERGARGEHQRGGEQRVDPQDARRREHRIQIADADVAPRPAVCPKDLERDDLYGDRQPQRAAIRAHDARGRVPL